MNIVRGGTCEEYDRAFQIIWRAPAPCGNTIDNLLIALAVCAQLLGIIGRHIAGCDSIDINSFGRPFIGEQASDAQYTAFDAV